MSDLDILYKGLADEEFVIEEESYEEITLENEEQDFEINIVDGEYVVTGRRIENLMRRVNVGDLESRQYMQRSLKQIGVMSKLREMGIEEGDTVDILDYKFEWEE